MPDYTVRVKFTGSAAELERAMEQAGLASAKTSKKMEDNFGKATSKIGKSFSSLGSLAGQFGIPIEGVLDSVGSKFDAAKAKGEGFKGKLSAISGVAAGASAAAIGAVAIASIHLADAYDTTQVRLDAAVKASGESMQKWQGPVGAAQAKMAALGFTADDTNSAIAAGVVSTQSTGAAIKNLGIAADLARFKHISLADASNLVDRALTGNLRPLKALGIDLPIAAGGALKLKNAHQALATAQQNVNNLLQQNHGKITQGTKAYPAYQKALEAVKAAHGKVRDAAHAHDVILEALSKRMGGQATAYSKTFAGAQDKLKATLHNTGVEIGQKLMPVVSKLIGFFAKIVSNKAALTAVFIVLGGILLGMIGVWVFNTIAAMSFWAAATGGIIILVAALAIGIAWIVTHWSQIWGWVKGVVTGVWHHIVDAFHSVINWLGQNWPLILTILTGPIGLAIWFIKDNWNSIVDFFKGAISAIGSIFGSIGDAITGAFKAAFNFVADIWNDTVGSLSFHIPGWVPVIGGDGFSMPKLPHWRAAGGPVSPGLSYIVGEKGPELFQPTGAGTIVPNSRLSNAVGGGHTVNIYAQTNASAADIANELGWTLRTQAA